MKIEEFIEGLQADFFTGVPDSLLRPFCDYIYQKFQLEPRHHVVAANEGNAAAIAAGYHLSTGRIPVVYLQNSGEGNMINPFLSLLSREVYGIPVIFVIGWRGEPGLPDEPQHKHQGKVTIKLLEVLGIPYIIVDKELSGKDFIQKMAATRESLQHGGQVAIVVCKDALENSENVIYQNNNPLTREEIIRHLLNVTGKDKIISTTGKASRELFELREQRGEDHSRDFLTVGSMGHSSSIALGMAIQKPQERFWCLDGDGSALMHMGAMAVIGRTHPKNLMHIVINNGAHESVGGMPTVASGVNLPRIALACGYDYAGKASLSAELDRELMKIQQYGLSFLEVKAAIGARKNLGRPTTSPTENKKVFMAQV